MCVCVTLTSDLLLLQQRFLLNISQNAYYYLADAFNASVEFD